MTTKAELKAKPKTVRVKFKSLLTKRLADGGDVYEVEAFMPYERGPGGYSKFETRFFVRDNEERIKDTLTKWPAETPIELVLTPGKVKDDKVDDGQHASYWWNVTDVAPSALAPGANQPAQAAEEPPLFPPEEAGPPPAGTERARPQDYWDAKDALIGMSWAIQEARAVVVAYHGGDKVGGWRPEFWDTIKKEIADLAPKFLAMREYLLEQAKKE